MSLLCITRLERELIDLLVWFSQVAQVLLTLPYSFSQLGMASGILFQLFYGLLGSWTAYLISVLYLEYRTRKEREKVDFRNHVIQVDIIQNIMLLFFLERFCTSANMSSLCFPVFCFYLSTVV